MMLALQLLAFVGAVQCLPWDGVKPTGVFNQPLGFQAPPQTTQVARLELHGRQDPGDATCGYWDGTSSDQIYCATGNVCATNQYWAWGCCSSTELDNCLLATACIDNTALSNYNSTYLANPYVTSCTDATAPNCISEYIEYSVGVEFTGFDCGNTDSDLTQSFYTTASNTTVPPISFFNAVWFDTLSPATTTSMSPPTTSPSHSPSTSPLPSTSTSTSSTPSPTPPPGPNPAPIGAIVGGVVGGVAAIAIVVLIIFFLRHNRKKNNEPQPQYLVAAPMQQTQGPPPSQPPQVYPQQPQQYKQYSSPSSAHSPTQNYPPAGYQTAYPKETAPQETTFQVYGAPPLGHNEPLRSGLEQRISTVPSYSPDPNSSGGFDSKNDMAINAQPAGHYHELSEQNR